MSDGNIEALVSSVTRSIADLEEKLELTQASLNNVEGEISDLPQEYVQREEARLARLLMGGIVGILAILIVVAFSLINYVDGQYTKSCRETRSTLRSVINIAVADQVPLSTATPEIISAIEERNARIRPLRERLLSLDGTQSEKC